MDTRARIFVSSLLASLMLGACSNSQAPATPGGDGGLPPESDPLGPRTRYSMANRCFALQTADGGRYLAAADGGFAATAQNLDAAAAFYMKPAQLGQYLIYSSSEELLSAAAPVSTLALSAASDAALWTAIAVGDDTSYPVSPQYHVEPTPAEIDSYRSFVEPNVRSTRFRLMSGSTGLAMAAVQDAPLTAGTPDSSAAQQISFIPTTGCAPFPEAQASVVGDSFKGTTADGRVLGMTDAHVHISSTNFLGGAQHGDPFHRFGVAHALGDCDGVHGPNGTLDLVGSLLGNDLDGHATDGWPSFTEWPARNALTHEAIYWKWLERSWKAGLRVVVNDLVDNETLCELQRNLSGTPLLDCNSMNNAGRQAGSMYAMQNYIDAQYGGRGNGWFQIVHSADEARAVVEAGKLAVILGIEISNLLDCKITYNPLRSQLPHEETGAGLLENSYGCAMTETGAPNEIVTQLDRLWGLGVRQIISIHEFDNAFGGNGIFDGLVLNVGNRENSGGIPSGDIATLTGVLSDPTQIAALGSLATLETPTGEFWTTYTCPEEGVTPGFSGYLWSNSGGTVMTNLGPPAPLCPFLGQGGRPGGTLACYPAERQCNARWMTPIGLYFYGKLMEYGFIFDFDHMEMGMKTQALELAEAQRIAYPFVSTHGTFGGTSNDQARRVLRNGGVLYPSLGNGRQHINLMQETLGLFEEAFAGVPAAQRPLFGFGFGTDTNGLSGQSGPRGNIEAGKEVVYPYTLFDGAPFDQLPDFAGAAGVQFLQPEARDPSGAGRSWHIDLDGSAHHGMLSGMVQEVRLEGSVDDMRHLFNSAEVYLRMWSRTEDSAAAIAEDGLNVPAGILRPAPDA